MRSRPRLRLRLCWLPLVLLATVHAQDKPLEGPAPVPTAAVQQLLDDAGGLKTIGALSRQMVEAGLERKTIVAIGSGWLFDRPIPPPAVGLNLRQEWIGAMQAMALVD